MGIRSFFNKRFSKKKDTASVGAVLPGVLSRQQIQKVASELVDRREILEVSSAAAGIHEEQLRQRIAARIGIPAISLCLPMELEALNGRWTFDDLRRCGSVAITAQGMLDGLICADPALVSLLPGGFSGRLLLGPWREIRRALDDSERLYLHRTEERAAEKRRKLKEAAQKVLRQLVAEVSRFGSSSFCIHLASDEVRYLFVAADGRQARGKVDRRVATALRDLLDETARDGKSLADALEAGKRLVLLVRVRTPGVLYEIECKEEHPAVLSRASAGVQGIVTVSPAAA